MVAWATAWVDRRCAPPDASADLRARTRTFVGSVVVMAVTLTAWVLPMVGFGVHPWAWGVELGAAALVAVGLPVIVATRDLRIAVHTTFLLGLVGGFALQSALGGIRSSGFVHFWFLFLPLMASLLLGVRAALFWLGAFVLVTVGAAGLEDTFAAWAPPVPDAFRRFNQILNTTAVGTILVAINLYLVTQLDDARRRADDLLENVLPRTIAERLKHEPAVIADRHGEVTVLFADLAGFTRLAADADPSEVVAHLDEVFSAFDGLAARHGLEKIKTIGDAYMAVAGLPHPSDDHAAAAVAMARDMLRVVQERRAWNGEALHLRVGIHSGPVVAGVIGRRKFAYDVWGDTVNTASRMESSGVIDRIQVSEATAERLGGRFALSPRAPLDVKGKGTMRTFLVDGA